MGINNFGDINSNLESKIEFYNRVRRDFSKLSLDKEPFDADPEIIEATWNICRNYPVGSYARGKSICEWISNNFVYDNSKNMEYASAGKAFRKRKGVCVDFSFLYTAMARVAGIPSYIVDVVKDDNKKPVNHICAVSYFSDYERYIFADCAYKKIDINHEKYRAMNDDEAIRYYKNSCIAINNKDFETADLEEALMKNAIEIDGNNADEFDPNSTNVYYEMPSSQGGLNYIQSRLIAAALVVVSGLGLYYLSESSKIINTALGAQIQNREAVKNKIPRRINEPKLIIHEHTGIMKEKNSLIKGHESRKHKRQNNEIKSNSYTGIMSK